MKGKNFTKRVVTELLEDNFSVCLLQSEDETGDGGWIDVDNRHLTATVGGWGGMDVGILVHEYSHYLQWKTNRRFFNNRMNYCDTFFKWIEGSKHTDKVVDKALEKVIELEWDCEKRAIELIKKHRIEIDLKRYKKAASSSILFYHIAREKRKWCEYSPFDPRITRSMPEELQSLEYYLDKDNIKDHQREKYLEILVK